MVPDYELQVVRENVRGARMGPLHLAVYEATPTREDLVALDAAHARVREAFVDRSAVFSYVRGGIGLPESDVREFVAELQREVGPHVRCSATVLGGGGFWASAAISLLNTWTLISRVPSPQRSFAEIEAGAAWVAEHLADDDKMEPSTIAAALQRLLDHQNS